MKQQELLKEWQKEVEKYIPGGLSLDKHKTLLETLGSLVAEVLKDGKVVTLPFLGKLEVRHVEARKCRNPWTGTEIAVPAKKKCVLKQAKNLKMMLNQ